MKLVVDMFLVELLLDNMPYDELVGYYEYTHEEITEAKYYINHTAPDTLIAMLEEAVLLREEEEALWEVWAEHCW